MSMENRTRAERQGGAAAAKCAQAAALEFAPPPLPPHLKALVRLLDSRKLDLDRVTSLLQSETQLASRVAHAAGAVLLGAPQRRRSLEEAVLLLGAQRLRSLVWMLTLGRVAASLLPEAALRHFWRHSLATAFLAERIAQGAGGPSAEMAYVAGMLHAIGALPLTRAALAGLASDSGLTPRPRAATLEAEREVWGADHCQVGQQMAQDWGLPEDVAQAVAHHHAPAHAGGRPCLAEVVAAACRISLRSASTLGCLPISASPLLGDSDGESIFAECLPGLEPAERVELADRVEEERFRLFLLLDSEPPFRN